MRSSHRIRSAVVLALGALGLVVAAGAARFVLRAGGGAPVAHAADAATEGLVERTLAYPHDALTCVGFLSMPAKAPPAGVPGVLVVHDWMGNGESSKAKARALAAEGYAALAVDMYGDGKRASGPEEARALAGAFYADPALMAARLRAGLVALRAVEGVARDRVAALGYCFGGSVCLQLARAGDDLAGVISFHGGLKTGAPATEAGALKARVLVLHGGADPFVPPADVAAFMDEMNRTKARWRMEVYGSAVHSFTNPAAGNDPSRGAAYEADADARSLAASRAFLAEVLAR